MKRRWRVARKQPTPYYLQVGVIEPKKRHIFRYVLVLLTLAVSSGMMANFQFNRDTNLFEKQLAVQAEAESMTKTVPIKTYNPGVAESTKPYLDPNLQNLLNRWADNHQEVDWSVAMQGLDQDKRFAAERPASWYVPASLYKVMMTPTLFKSYSMEDLNTISIKIDAKSRSLKSCVESMLLYSDNVCGEAVGKFLGWWRIEKDLHQFGLKNTFLNRQDSMFSTAEDAAIFMQQLYEGKLMQDEQRSYILGLLQQQKYRNGIPAGCHGCGVANKTGDLGNVRHDVAVVQSGSKTYVLAIFTTGASYGQIAELTKQINDYMTAN